MSLKKQFSKSKPVCKVTFNLPKEAVNGGKKVVVLGDFNNWDPVNGLKMKSGKTGYTATIELPTGKEYEFRYLIDQMNWTNDWEADAYRPSDYFGVDNSVVLLTSNIVEEKMAKVAAKKPVAKKATVTKKKVVVKSTAKNMAPKKIVSKNAKGDDLTKIEGVGPKISGLLVKGGFSTFDSLSKATKTEIKAILDDAGKRYQMHDPTSWPKQAKLAAVGKWAQLKTLQDKLKGGK